MGWAYWAKEEVMMASWIGSTPEDEGQIICSNIQLMEAQSSKVNMNGGVNWIVSSEKSTLKSSLWSLWRWLYLETGSLQMELVKMRPHWVRVTLYLVTGVLTRRLCEGTKGRDDHVKVEAGVGWWLYKLQDTKGCWQPRGKAGRGLAQMFLRRNQPCGHLDLRFWPPELWDSAFLSFEATRFVQLR